MLRQVDVLMRAVSAMFGSGQTRKRIARYCISVSARAAFPGPKTHEVTEVQEVYFPGDRR